ncbi:MAG: efflux RND transporter permease subunit, partial [Butyricicoccus sp.]
ISGEYRTMDELAHTIVSASETGTPVYLSDVATIRKTDQEMDELVRIGGKPGVLIGVKYADGIKVPDVQKRLMAVLEDYRANGLYADMQMDLIYDQAVYISDSVRLFTTNLIEAVLLLLVVVLLTMGVKSAVIVSLPIPLVSFAVFVYMLLTGIPLHQVSIASLIICLSLMVANGIVSNDNIHIYQERGEDIFTACTAGVREVRIPILTSTLTTIASFLPFLMMNGSAGKFVRSLPILVSVALVMSYITSLTVVPALGFTLLHPSARTRPPRKKRLAACKHWLARKLHLGGIGAQFSGGYEVLLRLVLRGPKRFICLLLALFAGTLCLVPSMKIQLFPPIEREQYVLNVTAQDGAAVEKTAEIAGQVADVLAEQPSISQFSCTVGKGYMKYYVTFFPNDQASNKAQFLIDGSRAQAAAVERAVQQAVPGIQTAVRYLEINLPAQWPIQVRIAGKDTDTLRALAEQAAERLRSVEGVQGTENNYGLPTYKLEADVKEETASLVGLTNYEIASTVRMAVNGTEISEFRQEDMEEDALPIVAKVADEDKTAREMLDSIFLTSSVTGSNIPLTQVADIRTDSSLGKILRRNSDRTITVGLYVADGYNTNEVLASVQAALEDFSLPAGYELTYGGENENSQEAFSSLVTPMILAIVLIYLILVFQFGDLAQPFLIMGTIPLSFIGVLLGLKGMGYPIGFMALLGAISLMGVVVNNGIVLLDYIGLQLPQFDDPLEAIVDACKTRLRPIMIGMITTVISLLPLMLSGGDLWAPLAASVVYGMLFSSVLTMLFIPAAFLLLHRSRQKRRPLPHV